MIPVRYDPTGRIREMVKDIEHEKLSLASLRGSILEHVAEMPCKRCGEPLGNLDECVEVEDREMVHMSCVKQ